MLIKVQDATEAQINWLVAKCEGHAVTILTVAEQTERWFMDIPESKMAKERESFNAYIAPTLEAKIRVLCEDGYKRSPTHDEAPMQFGKGMPEFSYATNPLQAWPIIEREDIAIGHGNSKAHPDNRFCASKLGTHAWAAGTEGRTKLIAAMRCYVISKLGETAEVPDEI